jgi:hypothetical protein
MKPIAFSALALILALPLTACGQAQQTGNPSDATQAAKDAGETTTHSMISEEIQKAMQKAKQELATKNIDVNNIHIGEGHKDNSSQPKAEITPQGDLLIAGNKVAATPAQQVLLLDYRKQIVGIAEAGMDIGTQGADLGIQASKAALWGKLTGKSDKDIEASIKPQTDKIEVAALQLCKRLPEMLTSQHKLAAAMPEFRPYATMEQKDIDDCSKEKTDKDGRKGVAIFSE